MKVVRDKFIIVAHRVALVAAGLPENPLVLAPMAEGSNFWRDLATWIDVPGNRRVVLSILWILVVFAGLFLTALCLLISFRLTPDLRAGIIAATALWASIFGIAILFFLPSKLVTTTFGALLGISLNEVTTGATLVSKTNMAITDLAKQISLIVNGTSGTADPFIGWVTWLFIGLIALICLPAFF